MPLEPRNRSESTRPGAREAGTLLGYLLVTFALSWALWQAAFAMPAPLRTPLFLLGVFVPALVAIAFTARAEGRAGVAALVGRIGRWDVGARWYLFAAVYLAAVKLAVALVHRLATGAWPRFGDTPWPLMALALLVSTWVQAGEELGWRGFALPRLAALVGLAPASVLLGVVWAAWHLPHFARPESDLYGQSLTVYALQVTAISVAMAWLFWRTGGSLLPVMLFHAAVNNTKDIVPSAVTAASPAVLLGGSRVAWLTIGLLWLGAGYFLFRMRGVRRLP